MTLRKKKKVDKCAAKHPALFEQASQQRTRIRRTTIARCHRTNHANEATKQVSEAVATAQNEPAFALIIWGFVHVFCTAEMLFGWVPGDVAALQIVREPRPWGAS